MDKNQKELNRLELLRTGMARSVAMGERRVADLEADIVRLRQYQTLAGWLERKESMLTAAKALLADARALRDEIEALLIERRAA